MERVQRSVAQDPLNFTKKIMPKKNKKDPYMSRNEFKPGFYDQKDRPPITAETMYGKGTKKQLEYPTVDPDTKMMEDAAGYVEGGFARGQKAIQIKKVPFRGVF